MTIREVFIEGIDLLKKSDIKAPVAEAGAILCFILNCDKAYLYTHGEYLLKEQQKELFFSFIVERSKGKPTQYIKGYQEFMSLRFNVNSDVLIPRQETELLVERVISHLNSLSNIKYLKESTKKVEILDIGTGSGCIAVSLAYYQPNSFITAIDISEAALSTAYNNAVNNGVESRIEFICSDLFSELRKCFDVIVSNPPYIRSEEILELQPEVKKYEPILALDGGIDGLDYYRRIVREAPAFLKVGGLLALEVGYDQAYFVKELMEQSGFRVNIVKDLAKIDRVLEGTLIKN